MKSVKMNYTCTWINPKCFIFINSIKTTLRYNLKMGYEIHNFRNFR